MVLMLGLAGVSKEEVTKFFILDVGMEKQQKQELGWRISVVPIPAFQCLGSYCSISLLPPTVRYNHQG